MIPKLSIVDTRKHAEIYKIIGNYSEWDYTGYEVKKYIQEDGIINNETFERYILGYIELGKGKEKRGLILTSKLVCQVDGNEFLMRRRCIKRTFDGDAEGISRANNFCLKVARKSALEYVNHDCSRFTESLDTRVQRA